MNGQLSQVIKQKHEELDRFRAAQMKLINRSLKILDEMRQQNRGKVGPDDGTDAQLNMSTNSELRSYSPLPDIKISTQNLQFPGQSVQHETNANDQGNIVLCQEDESSVELSRSKPPLRRSISTQTMSNFEEFMRLRLTKESKTYPKKKLMLMRPQTIMTMDTVTHYIIYPIVLGVIGCTNDYFLYPLSLCLNKKKLRNDERCKPMFRGFYTNEPVDVTELKISTVTGWYTSCLAHDKEKIGKIAGYFLRRYACSVAAALDDEYIPQFYPLIDVVDALIEPFKQNKVVVPTVLRLDISPTLGLKVNQFVQLSEGEAKRFIGEGVARIVTRRLKLFTMKDELHDTAWQLLDTLDNQDRQNILKDMKDL